MSSVLQVQQLYSAGIPLLEAYLLPMANNRTRKEPLSQVMKRMRAVESDSVKLARKAKDKLHKACERASETRERTLHRQEQTECAWQA